MEGVRLRVKCVCWGGARGYHCSHRTLIDNELPQGLHIFWCGLPSVPPPSKDGESPNNPNVPCSMGWGGLEVSLRVQFYSLENLGEGRVA